MTAASSTRSSLVVGPLTLVPLATMTITLRRPFVLEGTPAGTRMIFEVEEAVLDGERLRGRAEGRANGDWLLVAPDGTGQLDVRALLRTDDDAWVFIQYLGRVSPAGAPGAPVYATPRFETGDERYHWLNAVQAVGKGAFEGRILAYELYELR